MLSHLDEVLMKLFPPGALSVSHTVDAILALKEFLLGPAEQEQTSIPCPLVLAHPHWHRDSEGMAGLPGRVPPQLPLSPSP